MSEVFVRTDARRACSRGVIESTMGTDPRGTGSNPVEKTVGTFFTHAVCCSFFSDTYTHTHTRARAHISVSLSSVRDFTACAILYRKKLSVKKYFFTVT